MKTVELKNYTGVIHEGHYAFFEHNEYGEDDSVTMYLNDKLVTDYDHCYEIPVEVMKFMVANGYDLRDVVNIVKINYDH